MATRIDGRPPKIDGRLDDTIWQSAQVLTDLVQQRPIEGAEPSEKTQIYILYDDGALYIGARMLRADPGSISRTVTRRDGFGNAERLSVTFDTHLDRRTGYAFAVSAAGVRSDYHHSQDDEMRGRENQFDPVWDAKATLDSTGWSAEMRIPFSQLRFAASDEQRWGFQIDRWLPDKNEDLQWIMIPARETGYISRFGTLEGIRGISATRPVELLPYAAGDATRRAHRDARNPFDNPFDWRVGLDAKFGIGPNLTLDATINPDFGQVEADPAEVNLSAFETIFEERRPFFIEGQELLRAQGPNYFYSRRVGAPPHGSASGDYVDSPVASTILGAAKLTGRTASRLSVGSLLAVTSAEHARSFAESTGEITKVRVEPRTAFGVIRLQQEVGSQASTIGASLTALRRDFAGSTDLAALLPRDAYSGGLDWRLRWQQGKYALTGWVGFSHIAGDSLSIARVQRSSAHFFQRPDAEYATYDPSRRSMSGYTASIRADKDAGRRILWGAQVIAESPGYEVNDLGRLQSGTDIEYNADIQIRETLPGRYLRNWRLGFDTRGAYNYDGDHQSNMWSQNTSVTFKNFWNLNIRTGFQLAALDDALTRGGPVMGTPFLWGQELRINSPFGAATSWGANVNWHRDDQGGSRLAYGGRLTMRPAPRWSLTLEPNISQQVDPRQYVTTLSDGSPRTYGKRYIFALVDRRTISVRTRMNYAFSPTLTLEGYAEPFVASGRYGDFGELLAARSAALRTYGTDGTTLVRNDNGTHTVTDGAQSFTLSNRDFHVLSFRSNMVLRWEWTAGSTLFLVWQQNRRTSESIGTLARARQLWQTTRADGDNFLSLKVSYWLPL